MWLDCWLKLNKKKRQYRSRMEATSLCLIISATLSISPDKSQFFRYDRINLTCASPENSIGWTLRRNVSSKALFPCKGDCILDDVYPTDTDWYWCQSEDGKCSNVVSINVTAKPRRDLLLPSPPPPPPPFMLELVCIILLTIIYAFIIIMGIYTCRRWARDKTVKLFFQMKNEERRNVRLTSFSIFLPYKKTNSNNDKNSKDNSNDSTSAKSTAISWCQDFFLIVICSCRACSQKAADITTTLGASGLTPATAKLSITPNRAQFFQYDSIIMKCEAGRTTSNSTSIPIEPSPPTPPVITVPKLVCTILLFILYTAILILCIYMYRKWAQARADEMKTAPDEEF
ncbi:hypothetical protein E3U43_007551 [Larimichthys crocea]|uniref:Uncharacterized protein n=1 Tax=Larimichthys crocea TaxID=215358 RepID=A0ACD3Q5Q7_LARCR|nr:hypothetical protein E3U43_007551 [Larimichthys crocea]